MTRINQRRTVERRGTPKRNRRRQNRHNPTPIRELERREHRNQENRHTQNRRINNAFSEAVIHARGAVMVAAAGCVRVRSSARARPVLEVCRVAGTVDGLNDLLVAHTLGHDNARRLQRQVHRRVNTGDFAELTLHTTHAGCAGHTLDIHVDDSGGLC